MSRTALTADVHATTSLLIATSVATRDYHPIHHDPDAARSVGLPGIILNVHAATALVAGFGLRAEGGSAELSGVELRLLRPVIAGDDLQFTALASGGGSVQVDVRSQSGPCLSGVAFFDGRRPPRRNIEPADEMPAVWREFVGRPFGPVLPALEPVVEPVLVRLWREAFERPATQSILPLGGFGATPVPAPMLGVWDMPGAGMADSSIWSDDREVLRSVLAKDGFTQPLTVTCEQRYVRALKLGESLSAQTVLESITGPRHTALGVGVFLRWRTDLLDSTAAIVGSSTLVLLRYRRGAIAA